MSGLRVDPLANPKGMKRECELCRKPAHIQCAECRVTFYCGEDHQQIDRAGIHEKICQLLIPLRTTMPFLCSEDERIHRKNQLKLRQKQLVDIARKTGQKLLFEGRHTESIPAALQCLQYTIQLYGLSSVELIPSYLILGESSIGLGKLAQAEDYLSQAQWTVMKNPDCPFTIRHRLCRNLGLLYVAKGDYDRALMELADDIYYASEQYDPHHVQTSSGYFHMANIFFRQGKMETANSLYELVTDIWHGYLTKLVQSVLEGPKLPTMFETETAVAETDDKETEFDETLQAEASQVLNAIFDITENQRDDRQERLAKIGHALAMLYYLLHDIDKAKEFGRRAVGASGNIQDEEFSREIVDFLKVCENVKTSIE